MRLKTVAALSLSLAFAGLDPFSSLRAQNVSGQSALQPTPDTAQAPDSASIVVGHPFSAIKYSRLVKVLPNGKEHFLRNETYPVLLARDNDGRIHVQEVKPYPPCDQLTLRVPPPCLSWNVFFFDPTTTSITHWPEGERAAHVAVTFKITSEQADEAEKDTWVMPKNESTTDEDGGNIVTEDLGKKTLEGVLATGSRTTILRNQGQASATKTIHEVWMSEDMRLVIKVVDGDPGNAERISGLEHISLDPDSSLFAIPEGYDLQRRNTVGEYAGNDLTAMADWFVTQESLSPTDLQ